MKILLFALLLLCSLTGCQAVQSPAAMAPATSPDWSDIGPPSTVEIRWTGSGYELLRNGQPYFVRGVGGYTHLDRLAAVGANSIRTWDGEGIDDLLNEAHAKGLSVCVGIWLVHERHGHDYNDPAVRQEQLDKVRRIVKRYREHPAVLAWGVGNEVELGGDLDTALRSIEEAAALIKTLDTRHPTMAIIAEIGDDKARRISEECPSIDIIGVNAYGGAASVPERLLAQGYSGPYMITEFGPLGHWEGPSTEWGAPIEQASHQKALFYASSYRQGVEAERPGRCLGSYAFLWGHKQETTATWFGLLLPTGETTEAVDYLSRFWTGRPPRLNAPRVSGIRLQGIEPGAVEPGQQFTATVNAHDPDGDPLEVEWKVVHETSDRRSGGDAERVPPTVPDRVLSATGLTATIAAPDTPGAYRLFVFVRDGTGRAGTANVPFLVVE
ncbi:MAG: hypothetical protein LAT64_02900 [Phycisphaerales bacterium]|nr:hypothetical protein [Planctomycetota bacterium]MCH8507706.1 hypothetical protein [Phycisphaerales bacterium]